MGTDKGLEATNLVATICRRPGLEAMKKKKKKKKKKKRERKRENGDSSHSEAVLVFFFALSLSSIAVIPNRRRKFVSSSAPPQLRSEVSFSIGTHLIPHPNKVDRGGEDAFFVSSFNGGVIDVADGVSGWAAKNVDPSLFPKELMTYASDFVQDEEVNYDPQILMKKTHAATSSKGSATVCILEDIRETS